MSACLVLDRAWPTQSWTYSGAYPQSLRLVRNSFVATVARIGALTDVAEGCQRNFGVFSWPMVPWVRCNGFGSYGEENNIRHERKTISHVLQEDWYRLVQRLKGERWQTPCIQIFPAEPLLSNMVATPQWLAQSHVSGAATCRCSSAHPGPQSMWRTSGYRDGLCTTIPMTYTQDTFMI